MKKLIILTSVILFSGLTGASRTQSEYATQDNAALVSAELIREAGWTRNWQMNLPLKTGEKIAQLNVMGPRLYAMTDTNILFCIDRKKGRIGCSSQLSSSQLPVCKPLYYEDKFWFIVGSEMLVFDPAVGDLPSKRNFLRSAAVLSVVWLETKTMYISVVPTTGFMPSIQMVSGSSLRRPLTMILPSCRSWQPITLWRSRRRPEMLLA